MVNRHYLTHDEQQAAEAAFTNKPPAEGWSEAGKRVYWGLVEAMKERERKLVQVAVGIGQVK